MKVRTFIDKLMSLISAVLFLIILWNTYEVKSKPYRFSQDQYLPKVSALCPGDDLVYVSKLSVLIKPQTLIRVSTFYSESEGKTVVSEKSPDWINWDSGVAESIERSNVIKIPDNFKAGNYRYIVSLNSLDKPTVVYSVPFTVLDKCNTKPS